MRNQLYLSYKEANSLMMFLSREDRMGPVYRLNRPVKGIIVVGVIITLSGCTGDLWNRISDLEQQMATMTGDSSVRQGARLAAVPRSQESRHGHRI